MTTAPSLRSLADLAEAGLIAPERVAELAPVVTRYALAIPAALARTIAEAGPDSALARQFVPSAAERATLPEEITDPIGDHAHSPVKGLVHRYPDRVLLKPVHACPVYCRFCFRREHVGPGGESLSEAEMARVLAYIGDHREIWEVVLSGGDPMILSARRLDALLDALEAIPHIGSLRIHSRVPVLDPARITPAVIAALRRSKPVWLVIHANHPDEFTAAARACVASLADAGVPLLSQSVLLKGVNDDLATLTRLMRTFVANRIKPYYLHQTDMAPGTAHFRTSLDEGRVLVAALRATASGLCQPTYVLDAPDGPGKRPIDVAWG
ncbi:lysine 2,3-aminomutase [Rhodospirillum rubrum]|uniref:lysine-2,3-aminomutase-like protein n=1 Tax=Rhodospirillum rubrum TaxID=1085 RepID=UPI0019042105|nr:lysine-2,3-aminomutase-like protein [Rhodospirillum rubrum]MBK1665852.1 lysine 2,3-aminomutase [Rhodospirillum rubrum]MBK1677888.1 lysine 2,3-aminomutase [Rhodospirillum rubrum]